MYKEYLVEFWYSAKALENSKLSFCVPNSGIYGEVGVNTFKNAIGSHYVPYFNEHVAPSSIYIVRPWFKTIGSRPTELKDLPCKLNNLTREVKGLKKQVHELEIEIPGDLKEIPTKLDDFTKNVSSLTSQVAELKTLQWELLAEFLSLPAEVASVQTKLKTLDALPSILLNVTQALNKFAQDAKEVSTESESDNETTQVPGFMVEFSKKKELNFFDFVIEDGEHIHLTKEQISAQKKIEEKAKAKDARRKGEIRKEYLIDLLGPEVVNKYYNEKLQYDRYCDKILNKRAKSRITNCDILTKKVLITLKVYIEDDTSEIIPEFKASDLHLGKWWTSIYKQIQERIDYLRTTKAELEIDLDRPLSEQDPLDRLNDLANKKRKHADDIHDFFRANKRLKISSV
nr:hypothetical protein [Tanacetum cinerariifolium]